MEEYKEKHSFELRLEECNRIREKYPDRIPILVFRKTNDKASKVPDIDKNKFLVPSDLTFGQFSYVIRKRLKLKPEVALFLFSGTTIVPTAQLVSEIYIRQRDKDGFLYLNYCGENTFG